MSNKNDCLFEEKSIKFIDTHFHPIEFKNLFKEKNKKDLDLNEFLQKVITKKLYKLISISTKVQDFQFYEHLSHEYDIFHFSLGIHPCEINEKFLKEIFFLEEKVKNLVKERKKISGIGEIGIDLFHDTKNLKNQKTAFEFQIKIALENNLPIFIHTRNASEITYDILKNFKSENLKGIIHCFCDDYEWAKKFVDLNLKLGIGGVITYPKNNPIREAVKKIGIENIVYETDAPYLPPQNYRGKINSPEYINDINDYLSNYLCIDKYLLADKVYENTIKVINL